MEIVICQTKAELGAKAASQGAEIIRQALDANGIANVILATGMSQFEVLTKLVAASGIDWTKVHVFHLDEYAGMSIDHPASFRKYLKERFVEKLPVAVGAFHYINAEGDLATECDRLAGLIQHHPIDVAFIGIGENGHLAFNDPPADFETTAPYIAVELDEACRKQQLGEGWFPTMADVPTKAISMSVRHILKSKAIICAAPDERKAVAVENTVQGPVTPTVPASILQQHGATTLYLDRPSASLIS